MFRLKTLGSIDLREDAGATLDEALAQPKRVALLAYLAASSGSYVRRDTLLALLWPELDTERARHSLRQALYILRGWLGPAVIMKRGEEELGIDPAACWCDVVEFRRLLSAGHQEDGLQLYSGEFLAGFHTPEASEEFEDWIVATRQELREAATRAALSLVEEAHAAGDRDKALEYARRAASIEPLNEPVQNRLITLLGQKGDAAGARRAYKGFAERLERELGSKPSSATLQTLAEAERPRTTAAAVAPPVPPVQAPAINLPAPRSGWLRWVLIAAPLAVILLLSAVLLERRASHMTSRPVLAVTAIHQLPVGGDSTEALAIADLLATSLARLPTMQVISNARLIEVEQALRSNGRAPGPTEVARQTHATEVLEGTVFHLGPDSLVLELRRVDLTSGKVLHGYRVAGSDVFGLVDRATAEIARAAEIPQPTEGIADVTTTSLVAYRFYQEGLRSYYGGDATAARRLFESAAAEDSTFAMAMWYLARTEEQMDLLTVRDHLLAAIRLAPHASDRERLLITADVLRSDSRFIARAVADTLASRYPSDPEALWLFGMVLSSFDYVGAIPVIRRTIELDSGVTGRSGPACRLCDLYSALIFAYSFADSLPAAIATAREFVRRMPKEPAAWAVLAGTASLLDDTTAMAQAQAEYHKLVARAPGYGIDQRLLGQIRRGDYAHADTTLLSLGTLSEELRHDLQWYLLISLRNQGRLAEALALARDGTLPRGSPLPRWRLPDDSLQVGIVQFDAHNAGFCRSWYQSAATLPRPDLQGWPGSVARERAWALGRLAMCRAALGDTSGFEQLADSLESIGATSLNGRDQRLHHYVRGLLWEARRDTARAVTEFSAAISSPNFGFTRINYELGTCLLALHRASEAVAILQPALRGALDASNLYVTRTEIHERLAQAWEAAGNADSARVHWTQVDGAWKGADPEFRARWEVAHNKVRQGEGRH